MPNILTNPSFETDLTGWSATSTGASAARSTTDSQFGTASAQFQRDSGTQSNMVFTSFPLTQFAASPSQVWSAGAYIKLAAGVARSTRIDIRFHDSGGVDIGGTLGGTITPNASYVRHILQGVSAPASTAHVSMRIVVLSAAIGDAVRLDGMQLEQSATLPAYNEGGLGTPQNLVATAVSQSQINLTWNAVSGATGYDIERDSVIIVTNHNTNSYNDTGLSPSTTYTYRVRARQV